MKVLKFRKYLVPLVISGEKDSTWRLFDDKDLRVDDDIELQEFITNRPFATGKIVKVLEKKFGELTDDDKQGHETFETDTDMYAEYSKYYRTKVDQNTPLKIIWFEVTKLI